LRFRRLVGCRFGLICCLNLGSSTNWVVYWLCLCRVWMRLARAVAPPKLWRGIVVRGAWRVRRRCSCLARLLVLASSGVVCPMQAASVRGF
jgi:hypothetical protein